MIGTGSQFKSLTRRVFMFTYLLHRLTINSYFVILSELSFSADSVWNFIKPKRQSKMQANKANRSMVQSVLSSKTYQPPFSKNHKPHLSKLKNVTNSRKSYQIENLDWGQTYYFSSWRLGTLLHLRQRVSGWCWAAATQLRKKQKPLYFMPSAFCLCHLTRNNIWSLINLLGDKKERWSAVASVKTQNSKPKLKAIIPH